ncbi:hypothetical protein AB1N83_011098 [Pleurotus pulmonarius]
MVSFLIEDKDKGIETNYWVDLEGVSLDFDSTWMRSEAEICTKANLGEWSDEVEGCIRWVGPRSLEWVPSTDCIINEGENILVGYGEGYYGPLHTSVIAGWEDVKALAEGAEYQHGSARLEIKRDFRFGASTVRLIVRRTAVYLRVPLFKLSIVIEDIRRDEWNKLLRYQQSFKNGRLDSIVRDVRLAWRGNECVIEETPESPWQSNQNDVTNAVRHVALEALPLVLKYRNAQKEAAQRGQNNTNHLTAPLTAEAVASAVVRALDPRPCDGGRLVPQTGAGRKRKRDDEEDVEGPSRRQFRPMSIISSFCAALFSA